MTDDPLERLQTAMKSQTPPPSDEAKSAAIAAAMAEFSANRQGSGATARPKSSRPEKRGGIWTGVTDMLNYMTRPRLLMGTSALATLALAVVLTQIIDLRPNPPVAPGAGGQARTDTPKSLIEPAPGPLVKTSPEETRNLETRETFAAGETSQIGGSADVMTGADDADAPALLRSDENARNEAVASPALGTLDTVTADPAARERNLGFRDGEADLRAQPAQPAPAQITAAPVEAEEQAAAPAPGRQSINESLAGNTTSAKRIIAPTDPPRPTVESSTEAYPQAVPNALKLTEDEPVSTFSIDVDTAAYALVRSSLNRGQMPPQDAVRVEEMINYFDYAYPMPDSRETPFATSVSVAQTPWNPDTELLHIGIQGYDIAPGEKPPLNLVFLIDTSGSMDDPAKLPLLIQSFKMLLNSLNDQDSIAIVTYAGSAGMALEPTPAGERATILRALTNLRAGGSTAGQAGLQQAYALAEQMSEDGEISRVILATDGDFNVGISDPEALKKYIEEQRDSGTYLSVLGFGRGNYKDTTMQALAQNGNGVAAYIDTLAEAQKVLVEDVTGSLFPIAGDVKIQIEFNPAQISEYRLIGYETRALNREDFNNDAVDAGEIGAGHQVTALYEITPKGSPAERISDLRYAQPEADAVADTSAEYAFLKLRYKRPGEGRSTLIETPVLPARQDIPASETRFAAAVAGFGQLLRGEELPGWDYDDVRALAVSARGEDPYGYRSEFVSLVRIADALD